MTCAPATRAGWLRLSNSFGQRTTVSDLRLRWNMIRQHNKLPPRYNATKQRH